MSDDLKLHRQITLPEMYTLQEPHAANAERHKAQRESAVQGGSWYGNVKRENAVVFANAYTLPDSARRLYESLTQDLPVFTTATKRRTRHNREYGDAITDYARFEAFRLGVSRDTAFWSDMHRKERRHHGVVSVGINTGTACNQEQSELEFRGAAALALCDYLEGMGYRVQLLGLMGSTHSGGGEHWYHDGAVELKPANGLLSENGMAFVCHLGIWRHFYLDWLATAPHDVGWGHGTPRDYDGPITVDVTVPVRVTNETDARKWLTETLTRLKERGE